jgi:predicted deacylase
VTADTVAGPDPFAVPVGTTARYLVPFARGADGQPATFPLIVVAGARPGPTAALIAGIHGDEYEGSAALWRLAETVSPDQLSGRLLIVPMANLAAFAAGTRTSPIDLVNLARVFPGDPDGTLSQRLAHELFTRVVERSDLLDDCHSGGVRLAFLDIAGFYGPDADIAPELSRQSLELAKALRLSHLWRLPPRAGVLSYEALRRGIAATGGEIGGRGGCLERDWRGYQVGIRSVLSSRGMIERPTAPNRTYHTCLVGDWALAPVGGFIKNHVELGDRVRGDALLATICSPLGETLAEMRAKSDGLVRRKVTVLSSA